MSAAKVPGGLLTGGRGLWREVVKDHELDAVQLVQLEEACRAKDRCDRLAAVLSGDTFLRVEEDEISGGYVLRVDSALVAANNTANVMKQLLAAIRLPDAVSGKRPQYRGARGVQKPSAGRPVSSLERLQARSAG